MFNAALCRQCYRSRDISLLAILAIDIDIVLDADSYATHLMPSPSGRRHGYIRAHTGVFDRSRPAYRRAMPARMPRKECSFVRGVLIHAF